MSGDIGRWASLLFDRANALGIRSPVFELRMPNTSQATISGYYDSADALTKTVIAQDVLMQREAIYATLNPCSPSLLARATNRLKPYAKHTTDDANIVRRIFLPLDFDPDRPAGLSSIDAEHDAAIERARCTRDFLVGELQFPEPIIADSGNGAHLVFAIDLPNDAESLTLVNACLQAVTKEFGNDAGLRVRDGGIRVIGDSSVGNAARIWKVYGTHTRKGDESPTNPHRMAHLLSLPKVLVTVPREALAKLAALAANCGTSPSAKSKSKDAKASTNSTGSTSKGAYDPDIDIPAWLEKHGLKITKKKEAYGKEGDGTLWELECCPMDPQHSNSAACVIKFGDGVVTARCLHNGCAGKGWRDWLNKLGESNDNPQPLTLANIGSVIASSSSSLRGADLSLYLAPIIDVLATADRIVQEEHLDAIERRFGTSKRALNDLLRTAKRKALQASSRFERGDHTELAEKLLADLRGGDENENLVFAEGELYRYTPQTGLWKPVDRDVQARIVAGYAGLPISTADGTAELKIDDADTKGTLSMASRLAGNAAFFADAPAGASFCNGFLLWRDGDAILLPRSPKHRTRVALPFEYDSSVRATRFREYLRDCFRDDKDAEGKIQLLQEFVGACLFSVATRYDKVIVLLGEGANGKSVFIKVVSELFPSQTRASIPPQDFSDQYRKAMLAGVQFNSVSELPGTDILNSAPFKAVVTGEITGRMIYQPPFRFKPIAGHLFATNSLPSAADLTHAFWRRFIVIEWPRIFKESEQDKQLAETLISTEMPGIAVWAVEGGTRLLRRGGYAIPESCQTATALWRQSAAPVGGFVKECTIEASGSSPGDFTATPIHPWTQALVLFDHY